MSEPGRDRTTTLGDVDASQGVGHSLSTEAAPGSETSGDSFPAKRVFAEMHLPANVKVSGTPTITICLKVRYGS